MILVTGVAGFIGMHVAMALLDRGQEVVGLDNVNDYYDPALKEARLAQLSGRRGFTFHRASIADRAAVEELVGRHAAITGIVHLAAQAGVRYSLVNPYAYVEANVLGQVVMLEAARRLPRLEHLVYASSSSVYGGNETLPWSVPDRVDRPVSLYAATKRADELIGHTYAHLYGLPLTGLRFFTVYGPWGRPDMAPWLFTKALFDGTPLALFNHGEMRRDFTYIDDIVAGVLGSLERPPQDGKPRHRLYNLGNHRAERLRRFVELLEGATGRRAELDLKPMQPGDVEATYADITESTRDFGYLPTTAIEDGLPRFVAWYRDYHGL